jgi:hypothetical protein
MMAKNMRKVDKGNLKAFFTLDTPSLEINDCKLMEGRDSQLYAAMPQIEYQSNGQRKWKNIVYIKDKTLLDRISAVAREEYFKETSPPVHIDDVPF